MTDPEQRNGDGSPASLARASFGAGRFATVVGEERSGDWAVVLVLANEAPNLVPDETVFHRDGGRWEDIAGNDSPGWRSTDDGQGFVTFWGEAPDGASQVTVSYRGVTVRVPVVSRYFLAVFWGIPESDFDPAIPPHLST